MEDLVHSVTKRRKEKKNIKMEKTRWHSQGDEGRRATIRFAWDTKTSSNTRPPLLEKSRRSK